MLEKLQIYLAATVAALAFMWLNIQILKGQFNLPALIQMGLVIGPLVVLLIGAKSNIWMGLLIGILPFTFTLPVFILDRFPPKFILTGVIILLVLGDWAIRHDDRVPFKDAGSKFMIIVLFFLLGRFIYDRPGSARMGGSGGGAEAVTYVMAFLAFPVLAHITYKFKWADKKNVRTIIILLCIGFIDTVIRQTAEARATGHTIPNLFSKTVWMGLSFIIAAVYEKIRRSDDVLSDNMRLIAVMSVTMLLATMAQFRSRIYFAAGMIFSISIIFKKFRRTAMIFGLLSLVGISLAAINYTRLPAAMQRSLSTVIPYEATRYLGREMGKYGFSSELGWKSQWRREMYQLAIRDIKENPLIGRGFSFSLERILASLSAVSAMEAMQGGLAVSGGYHNSVIQLTVIIGIPVALLFVAGYVLICLNFFKAFPRIKDKRERIILGGIVGFFTASTGQMLMNGSGGSMFDICTCLGIMYGTYLKYQGSETVAYQQHRSTFRTEDSQLAGLKAANLS